MAIEYLGLSEINGPLVVLEGVKNASYEEIVEFHMEDGTQKIGRIVEIYEDKAVIQVFEGTDNMSLGNTHTRLTGHPMEIGLSPEILGRTFNGIGQPIDGLGEITPEVSLNINGLPLNPVTREYPRNYINTGISAIDGLTTLIRGQKLPIFSGNGLPHDKLAAQIVQQASLGKIRHCFCGNGCEIRRSGILPQDLRRKRCVRPRCDVFEPCKRSGCRASSDTEDRPHCR